MNRAMQINSAKKETLKTTVKRKKNLEGMLARAKKKKMNKIKLEMEMD